MKELASWLHKNPDGRYDGLLEGLMLMLTKLTGIALLVAHAAIAQVTLTSILEIRVASNSGSVPVAWTAKGDWAASADVDWLSFPIPHGGAGTWGRTLTWTANHTGESRIGHLIIGTATLTVTQEAADGDAAPTIPTLSTNTLPATTPSSVIPPSLTHKVEAEYTESAKRKKIQGSVKLSVLVTADGKTSDIKVIKGLGEGLDEKAVQAVYQWQFRPAMKDGKPFPCPATIEVQFRLP